MAQLFPKSANVHARVVIVGIVLLACGAGWATSVIYWSPYTTEVDVPLQQPIPFSHKHHVTDDGIDCRYCHTSVEKSSFAGIPSTETCMNCHSVLFANAAFLEPVRASFRDNKPLHWVRVHDLPDFVYFNHSIHIKKGVGCETCHGRIDQMPLTYQENSLLMEWCINCHKNPAPNLRPRSEITTMGYRPATDQAVLGPQLAKEYAVNPPT